MIPKHLKKILLIVIGFMTLFSICTLKPKVVKAQDQDFYECVGEGLAEYMNTVIRIAGNLEHIRLLSPAFNISSDQTPPIIHAMTAAGANWGRLYGISGNAYNHINPISYWVINFMDELPNLPLMLSETGMITGDLNLLISELNLIRNGTHTGTTIEGEQITVRYIGAALFNGFDTGSYEWHDFAFNDSELTQICNGTSCGIIGVNSAAGYHQGDWYYDKAHGLGMNKSVEIYTTPDLTTAGVHMALDRNINPVIRIGVNTSGPSATEYASYLVSLDRQLDPGDIVYAIAGPNEPERELWATPDCGDPIPSEGGINDPFGATPFPRPYVPCDETRLEEFHSLRPYQASPCNQNYEDLALFCGNDFMMQDTIVIEKIYYEDPNTGSLGPSTDDPLGWSFSWDFIFEGEPCVSNPGVRQCGGNGICEAVNCEPGEEEGMETCEFTIDREVPISINLDGAELPITGYTEPSEGTSDPYEVINHFNNVETMEDPEKVNEYVSWYLNGVIGRAEYGEFRQNTQQGRSMYIDYSGPLKRLLPFENQIILRNEEAEEAEDTRHDQIIYHYRFYESGDNRRLSEWADTDPPPLPSDPDFDTLREYFDELDIWRLLHRSTQHTFKFIPFSSTEDRLGMVNLGSYWVQPISPENVCIICAYITNQTPATLFFSHMQESFELADLLQQIHSPQGADLDEGPLNVQENDYSLCNIAEVRKNPGDNLFPTGLTATVEYTADVICEDDFLVHGDGNLCRALGGECMEGLYAGYSCTTYYNQVDCPDGWFCGIGCSGQGPCLTEGSICANQDGVCVPHPDLPGECAPCCPGSTCRWTDTPTCWVTPEDPAEDPYQVPCSICQGSPISTESWVSYNAGTCRENLIVAFQTQTHTPLATETWAKLVSGPYGAFRRIFPQIEDSEGRPIRRLWDIPAETDVQFNVAPPLTMVGGSTHQIYFPHIGGIHEYFLNCLQKTLRPLGYGQGCVSAPELSSNVPGTGQTYWCPTPPAPPPTSGQGCCTAMYYPDSGPGGSVMFCIDDAGDVWLYNNTDYFSRDPNIEGACQWFGVGPHDVAHVCYGYFPDPGSYFGLFLIEGPTPNQLACTVIK